MTLVLRRTSFNVIFKCYLSSTKVHFQNNDIKPKDAQIIKHSATNLSISKAMKAYRERAEKEGQFFVEKVSEYEIGKRHLANIMGRNVETFTQNDIDEAIEYLLPSGLFVKSARPSMKHPDEMYSKRKSAEFDDAGRPFHVLFYTGKPLYYELLQNVSIKAQKLGKTFNEQLQKQITKSKYQFTLEPSKSINLESSKWIAKDVFEAKLLEHISDKQYDFFILSMERLSKHPLAYLEEKFIMDFRCDISRGQATTEIPKLLYNDLGIPYSKYSSTRKKCSADVIVYGNGNGKIVINEENILYFENIQEREQVMFPLQFSKMMNHVDVIAKTDGPVNSKSGQAGAIRHALSMALRPFIDYTMIEKMRIAGLLTHDARKKERKKPGRRRARARYTWKKR